MFPGHYPFLLLLHFFILHSSSIYRFSLHLQLNDTPCPAFSLMIDVFVSPNFPGHSPDEFRSLPQTMVEFLFSDVLITNFSNSTLVFTGGSVSAGSAGFSSLSRHLTYTFPINSTLSRFLLLLNTMSKLVLFNYFSLLISTIFLFYPTHNLASSLFLLILLSLFNPK